MQDKPRPRVWPVFASLVLLLVAVRSFQAHSNIIGFLLLAAAIIIPFYFETTRKARLATVSLVLAFIALRQFTVHRSPLGLALLLGALAIPVVFDRKDAKRYYRKRPATSLLTGLMFVGLLLAMGAFEWFPPLDQWAIIKESLKYSLPLAALSTFIALPIERESSPRTKLAGILLASLFAFAPLCAALTISLNEWLDTAPPTTHLARVVDRHASSSRRGRNYDIRVESWREPAELEILQDVPRWMYDRAVPNGTNRMQIVTKPGRLGFEWIVSYEIAQSVPERTIETP